MILMNYNEYYIYTHKAKTNHSGGIIVVLMVDLVEVSGVGEAWWLEVMEVVEWWRMVEDDVDDDAMYSNTPPQTQCVKEKH